MEQKTVAMLLIGLLAGGVAFYLMGGGVSGAAVAISVGYQIPPALANKVVEVARAVGANPMHLAALINFESDGWKPDAINVRSGAVGLIQFMPSTLRRLSKMTGKTFTSSGVRAMTSVDQMELVRLYLSAVAAGRWEGKAGPLRTKQALYLAVFYPKARYWHPAQPFPSAVRRANPGVRVVSDYVRAIDSRALLPQ